MPAQRILIIKHGALGDVVLAMGTMKRLRELHPEAHITLMTMGMFVPMAEQLGVFDDFIVDNRLPYWKLGATWRAVRSIVRGNFDVVYDLQESSRTRKRYYPAVRFLLNHDMDWVACNSGERRKLLKKKSFRWGKVEREPFRLERVLTDLSFMHGEGLHFDELPERYVMMIPGCSPNHPYKRWPVENFCALAKRLAARGVSSVVIGTRAEAAEVEAIAASSPLAVSFLGKSSLMDIPQMALRSLACVGNDTGPTHMCAYAGVPVTAIFCHRTRNSAITARCISNLVSPGAIEEITVDQVWSALEPFLPPQEGFEQIRAAYVYRKRAGSITSGFASGSSLQSLDYLTVAELVLKEWKEAGILEEYRTAFLKMLVMGVRNIRKYAPHAVQKEVTRKVTDMLRQENLYRPAEDDACLSRREGKLLKAWMGGKSGLDFSYYWKKMRKAGARLLRR